MSKLRKLNVNDVKKIIIVSFTIASQIIIWYLVKLADYMGYF